MHFNMLYCTVYVRAVGAIGNSELNICITTVSSRANQMRGRQQLLGVVVTKSFVRVIEERAQCARRNNNERMQRVVECGGCLLMRLS